MQCVMRVEYFFVDQSHKHVMSHDKTFGPLLYNSALSFTSLGANIDGSLNTGRGPYVFHVHGVLYHLSRSLLPSPGTLPAYAQLYIHDSQAALDQQMQRNPNCHRDTMEALQNMLIQSH